MRDAFGRAINEGYDIVYATRRGSSLTLHRARVVEVWDTFIKVKVKDRKLNTVLKNMSHVVVV